MSQTTSPDKKRKRTFSTDNITKAIFHKDSRCQRTSSGAWHLSGKVPGNLVSEKLKRHEDSLFHRQKPVEKSKTARMAVRLFKSM